MRISLSSAVFSAGWPMEDGMDSPVAIKVEGHSRSVILRYFRGDIGSMVDAHFSRALSKDVKDNVPVGKAKKMRKNIKSGKPGKVVQIHSQIDFWVLLLQYSLMLLYTG